MATRRSKWKSGITKVYKDRLVTYGVEQDNIVRNFSYEEMVFLLLTGKRPTPVQAAMLRAVIVSHCSHGITGQSTLAVRMGADTRATLFNSVLGGFMVGSGPTHQGSLEPAMQELIAARESGDPAAYTREQLAKDRRLVGFGHRYHSFDPRARVHMELCDAHGYLGPYVQTARTMDDVLRRKKGIRMNIEASGGSILLDMGFPVEAAHLIILIGRGPMLAAAYLERLAEKKRPFQKIVVIDAFEED